MKDSNKTLKFYWLWKSCLILRGFPSSGCAVFPRAGGDNSATVYDYLREEEILVVCGSSWTRHVAEAVNEVKQGASSHWIQSTWDAIDTAQQAGWVTGRANPRAQPDMRNPKQKVQMMFGCAKRHLSKVGSGGHALETLPSCAQMLSPPGPSLTHEWQCPLTVWKTRLMAVGKLPRE